MQPEVPVTLAARLRALRRGKGITQQDVAHALDVSVPLVSSWESTRNPVTPPEERLRQYVVVLAAGDPPGGHWRGSGVRKLTGPEDARRRELEAELLGLRAAAIGPDDPAAGIGGGPWRFPDGGDVVIVCAEFDPDMRAQIKYAEPGNPDYVAAYRYADLDSLIELFGHIRATNPRSEVRFKLDTELEQDDYTAHLVLLGGVDWNEGTRRLLSEVTLPVEQIGFVGHPVREAGFVVREGRRTARHQSTVRNKLLADDVAQFVRGPNPFNQARTFTICNGMYGRGTLGAVRALTDARMRDRNAEYVRDKFRPNKVYSLLFRVVIFEGDVMTPDWTKSGTLLHEWSEPEVE